MTVHTFEYYSTFDQFYCNPNWFLSVEHSLSSGCFINSAGRVFNNHVVLDETTDNCTRQIKN